jgi:hypothetical protein
VLHNDSFWGEHRCGHPNTAGQRIEMACVIRVI